MNIKSVSIILYLNLISFYSFAASTNPGIPWDLITAQTINFSIFLTVIIFLLRKPAADYFKSFREDYIDKSTKAQKLVQAAEKQKKEIEDQLKRLETTYTSKLESSKKEAVSLKENLIRESQERAAKMIADTTESANLLFRSAEQAIKNQVLSMAVNSAKADFNKRIDAKESQRLHSEFLEEISAGSL